MIKSDENSFLNPIIFMVTMTVVLATVFCFAIFTNDEKRYCTTDASLKQSSFESCLDKVLSGAKKIKTSNESFLSELVESCEAYAHKLSTKCEYLGGE